MPGGAGNKEHVKLIFGVNIKGTRAALSEDFANDINKIITELENKLPPIAVKFEPDKASLKKLKTEIQNIKDDIKGISSDIKTAASSSKAAAIKSKDASESSKAAKSTTPTAKATTPTAKAAADAVTKKQVSDFNELVSVLQRCVKLQEEIIAGYKNIGNAAAAGIDTRAATEYATQLQNVEKQEAKVAEGEKNAAKAAKEREAAESKVAKSIENTAKAEKNLAEKTSEVASKADGKDVSVISNEKIAEAIKQTGELTKAFVQLLGVVGEVSKKFDGMNIGIQENAPAKTAQDVTEQVAIIKEALASINPVINYSGPVQLSVKQDDIKQSTKEIDEQAEAVKRLSNVQSELAKRYVQHDQVGVKKEDKDLLEQYIMMLEKEESELLQVAQKGKDANEVLRLRQEYEKNLAKAILDATLAQKKSGGGKSGQSDEAKKTKILTDAYNNLAKVEKQVIELTTAARSPSVTDEEKVRIEGVVSSLKQEVDEYNKIIEANKSCAKYQELREQYEQKIERYINRSFIAEGKAEGKEAKRVATVKQVLALYQKIDRYLERNHKASGTDEGVRLATYQKQLNAAILEAQRTGSSMTSIKTDAFKEMTNDVTRLQLQLKKAGVEVQSFGEWMTNAFKRFGSWMLVTHSITSISMGFRDIINNVIDLDTAMVELKKVTNETDDAYRIFVENAAVRAKSIGATMTDTINATADAARLGFDIDAASDLADSILIYQNVGDEIEDVQQASSNLISTMKGFGIEASDSMSIVDKFNEVANNYAISAGGIGDALARSAAALDAGNNTIEESIGLIVAANDVIQDPDVVGERLPNSAVMY